MLLFRAEMWVGTPQMERALSIFQHMVARQITRSQTSQIGEGRWEYPTQVAAIEEAGFEDIWVYMTRAHNMVVQYIAMRLILDI